MVMPHVQHPTGFIFLPHPLQFLGKSTESYRTTPNWIVKDTGQVLDDLT